MTYTIVVANWGQPTSPGQSITVRDMVPADTTLRSVGRDGFESPAGDVVTWTRPVTLGLGESTIFTFSVEVGDVPSGTVIQNNDYQVTSSDTGVTAGDPYTVTIVDPIFVLLKSTWPDPPGSNREVTYTLSLRNIGSLATNLVITDRVPSGVEYLRGGSESGGVISWTVPRLDTGEWTELTFTVYISDVMNVPIVNNDYWACAYELDGGCQPGTVLTSVVQGPIFEVFANVEPLAKKTGGEPCTPTLGLRNVGNGNAIAASVLLTFSRMSLNNDDIWAFLPDGTFEMLDKFDCATAHACRAFEWSGDIMHGEAVTFAQSPLIDDISTIGGEEGVLYTAYISVTDWLTGAVTPPATAFDWGKITHYASVEPTKSAYRVIGPGQLLTYTIRVINSGFSTQYPPILTDTVPLSTTFLWASDGGVTSTITTVEGVSPTITSTVTVISWTLDSMGPGDEDTRRFTVRVYDDLISGTQIINRDYAVFGYGNPSTGTVPYGRPFTTTVQEIGLIDSFKLVTPTLAAPGAGTILTYYLHIVNSSPLSLTGVTVYDTLPWESSTYRRDALVTSGDVVSDIVSILWTGDVDALSTEIVTATVLVDADYRGLITNTAFISHTDLAREVVVDALAYITDEPVLAITKRASANTVERGAELEYTIRVWNVGQLATGLVITDLIPAGTEYVPDSASAGGTLAAGTLHWEANVLETSQQSEFSFRVTVQGGGEIVNDQYAVVSSEGIRATGPPVITQVKGGSIYLPLVMRNSS
jgi:uncharacterized repeat protein (TIGR01451 family)